MAALQRGGIVGRWVEGACLASWQWSPDGLVSLSRKNQQSVPKGRTPANTLARLMKQTKNKKGFLQGEGGGGGTMMSRVAASSEFRAGVLSFGCVLAALVERATGNGYRKIRKNPTPPVGRLGRSRATRACLSYTLFFCFVFGSGITRSQQLGPLGGKCDAHCSILIRESEGFSCSGQ